MRRDLVNTALKDSFPLYPLELATAAFVWQCRQFYESGYLEYEMDLQQLNNTGQYVHTGFFIKNQELILKYWDYSIGRSWFDFGLFAVELGIVNNIQELTTGDERVANMFVRLYLSTFRRTLALGYHYATSPLFSNEKGTFSRAKMVKELDFDIDGENPFILMVDNLAYDYRWIAMFAAFMATSPNGLDFSPVEEGNEQQVYEAAVPNSDLAKFHQVMFNDIPRKDWIA